MHNVHFLEKLLEGGANDLLHVCSLDQEPLKLYNYIDSILFSEILTTGRFQEYDPVVIELGLHARNMWAAAGRLSLSGQPYAVPAVARTALESACYASLICREPELAKVWSDRHVDEISREKSKRAFGGAVRKVTNYLSELDHGSGAPVWAEYERSIDDGAHPNTRGIPRTRRSVFQFGKHQGDYMETSDYFSLLSPKTKMSQELTISIGKHICYVLALTVRDVHDLSKEKFGSLTDQYNAFVADCEKDFPGFSQALSETTFQHS